MESMFRSELEKDIWIASYVCYVPNGASDVERMRGAYALVLELREELDKLLAFGAWTRAAAEIVGNSPAIPGDAGSVFANDIERKIWISSFARHIPESDPKRSAKHRAKVAWERVLDFRNMPKPSLDDQWERALAELATPAKS